MNAKQIRKAEVIDEATGTHPQFGKVEARIIDYHFNAIPVVFEFVVNGKAQEHQVGIDKARELMAKFRAQINA